MMAGASPPAEVLWEVTFPGDFKAEDEVEIRAAFEAQLQQLLAAAGITCKAQATLPALRYDVS